MILPEYTEYTSWEEVMFCAYCNEHLTHRQYHDNKAICCHCGQLGRYEILPDIVRKSRRKHYTDGRQLAITAQKLRNSNIFVRLVTPLFARFRKQERPFIWEYATRTVTNGEYGDNIDFTF